MDYNPLLSPNKCSSDWLNKTLGAWTPYPTKICVSYFHLIGSNPSNHPFEREKKKECLYLPRGLAQSLTVQGSKVLPENPSVTASSTSAYLMKKLWVLQDWFYLLMSITNSNSKSSALVTALATATNSQLQCFSGKFGTRFNDRKIRQSLRCSSLEFLLNLS